MKKHQDSHRTFNSLNQTSDRRNHQFDRWAESHSNEWPSDEDEYGARQGNERFEPHEYSRTASHASEHDCNWRQRSEYPSNTDHNEAHGFANVDSQPYESSWGDCIEWDRPQSKFIPPVDNSESPFKPFLRSKPNAIRPLKLYLEIDKDGTEYYSNPYFIEMNEFKVPKHQLRKSKPIPASHGRSFDSVGFVDDDESLALMVSDLEKVTEIAIDSEYHSFRSFYGFICVLQISTRYQDFVIDAIALRGKLEVLNKFFTDPSVLKVMHAAHSDVLWLQKDLNLYLVNMFDTSLAALELNSRQSGLATLLKDHCDVIIEKNKDFQKVFDWRTRPLPREAILYSRDDTHYLLYLYDVLRNKLIEKSNSTDALMKVYRLSTDLCKKPYRKPPSGLPALLRKFQNDYRKSCAMQLLYEWRDKLCREMDESTGYILPNKLLIQLVDKLPKTREEIEDAFYPAFIPPIVETRLVELQKLIKDAREQPTSIDLLQSNGKKGIKMRSQGTQTENEDNLKVAVRTNSQSTQTTSDNLTMSSRSTQTGDGDTKKN